ncbi:MAG: CoA-binding protein [bacterium]
MPDDPVRVMFETINNIAVLGCSREAGKAAHDVPRFIQEMGYRIIPINPGAEEILGERAYPNLQSAHESLDSKIELVDVFRPSEEVPDHLEDILSVEPDYLWLQLGIKHDQTVLKARDRGIIAFQDQCLKVEYRKRFGDKPRSDWGTSTPS